MKISEELRYEWKLAAIEAAREFRPLFKASKRKWLSQYIDKNGQRLEYAPKVHDIVKKLTKLTDNIVRDVQTMKTLPKIGITYCAGELVVQLHQIDEALVLGYKYELVASGVVAKQEAQAGGAK